MSPYQAHEPLPGHVSTPGPTTTLGAPRTAESDDLEQKPASVCRVEDSARRLTSIRNLLNVTTPDPNRRRLKSIPRSYCALEISVAKSQDFVQESTQSFSTGPEAAGGSGGRVSRNGNRQSNADGHSGPVTEDCQRGGNGQNTQPTNARLDDADAPASIAAIHVVPRKRKAPGSVPREDQNAPLGPLTQASPFSGNLPSGPSLLTDMRRRIKVSGEAEHQGLSRQGTDYKTEGHHINYSPSYTSNEFSPVNARLSPDAHSALYRYDQYKSPEQHANLANPVPSEPFRNTEQATNYYNGVYGQLDPSRLTIVPKIEPEQSPRQGLVYGKTSPQQHQRDAYSHQEVYRGPDFGQAPGKSNFHEYGSEAASILPSFATAKPGMRSEPGLISPNQRSHPSKMAPPLRYGLFCRQQPIHARMCGFGEKDRRTLDPPPIIECFEIDSLGRRMPDTPQDPFLTLHVSLWNEDCTDERNLIATTPTRRLDPSKNSEESSQIPSPGSKITRVLMGSLVASPTTLEDEFGKRGAFFVFPDLSIRTEGSYRLKFRMFSMSGVDLMSPGARAILVGECVTDVFLVYSAKKFPGMLKSTELTKAFAKQGYKIQVRNESRGKRQRFDDDAAENDVHESQNSGKSSNLQQLAATPMVDRQHSLGYNQSRYYP